MICNYTWCACPYLRQMCTRYGQGQLSLYLPTEPSSIHLLEWQAGSISRRCPPPLPLPPFLPLVLLDRPPPSPPAVPSPLPHPLALLNRPALHKSQPGPTLNPDEALLDRNLADCLWRCTQPSCPSSPAPFCPTNQHCWNTPLPLPYPLITPHMQPNPTRFLPATRLCC